MASNTENIYVNMKVDTSQFNSSMQGMKREMIALKGLIGNNMLSKEDQQAVMTRLGDIRGQMEDLQAATKSMDIGDVFSNIGQIGRVGANAIGGVTAAMGALGIESEMTNDIERKLMMTIQLSMSLQELADAKRLKGMITMRAAQLVELVTIKSVTAARYEQVMANTALSASEAKAALGIGLMGKLQLAWNAAVAANPIGLLVAGIVALVAALGGLYLAFGKSEVKVKEYEKALDGTVIKDEEARKSYNESIKTLNDLGIEYELATGKITEFGAEIARINNEFAYSSDELSKKLAKDLEEITGDGGFLDTITVGFTNMWEGIKGIFRGENPFVAAVTAQAKKIAAVVSESDRTAEQQRKERDLKIKTATEKQERDINQKVIDFKVQRLKDTISALDQEYRAYLDSTTKILKLYTDLENKRKEFDKKKLTPEERDVQGVVDETKTYKLEVEAINKELTDEQKNLAKIGAEMGKNEALLKKYEGIQKSIGYNISKQISVNSDAIESLKAEMGGLISKPPAKSTISFKTTGEIVLVAPKALSDKDKEEVRKWTEEVRRVNQEIATREIETQDLETSNLSLTRERLQVETDLLKLKNLQQESQTKIDESQKKIEDKKKVVPVSDKELEEQRQKEINNIRLKYSRERQTSIINDENQILDIQIKGQQDIIDNEKLNDKVRIAAFNERNRLLKLQNQEQQKLTNLKIQEITLEKLVWEEKLKSKDLTAEQKTIIDEEIKVLEKKLELTRQIQTASDTETKTKTSTPFVPTEKVTAFSDWFNPEAWAKPMDALKANMGQLTQQTADTIFTIMQSNLAAQQQMVDSYIANQELLAEKANKNLDNLLKHNLITQTQYEKKKEKIEEEKNTKIKSIKQAQFRKEQDAAVTLAVIQGALAIVQAYGQLGPIAGTVAAVLIALVTAAQIDTISSQPVPTYAKGGEIKGPSHTEGGVKVPTPSGQVELEGGEFIINKTITQKSGIKSLLQTINDGKLSEKNMKIIEMVTNNNTQRLSSSGGYMFQMGGQIPSKTEYRPISDSLMSNVNTSSTNTTIINNVMDVEELKSVIREVTNIPVIVSEVDISSTQRKVKVTQDKANW